MKEGFPLVLHKCYKSQFYPCNANQLVVLFLRFLSAVLTRSSSKMRALDGINDYGSISHTSSVMSLSTSIADAASSEEEPNSAPSSARHRRRSSTFSTGGVSYGSSKSGPSSDVDLSQHMALLFSYATIWATYPVLATW